MILLGQMDVLISSFAKCFDLIAGLDPYLVEVAWLSIWLSLASSLASFAAGVPFGFFISEAEFPLKRYVVSAINTGMGLPPVVVGLFVALLLGRSGPFGSAGLLYTKTAIFVSQLIIAFPLSCGLTIAACAEIPENLKLTLRSLGAGKATTVYYYSRELRSTLSAILLASFGSVISEVGAVMMVGGNILGETRVLTTAIVSDVRVGNYEAALAFSIVLLAVTFAINHVVGSIMGPKKR